MSGISVKIFQGIVAGAAAAGVPPPALLAAAGLAAEDLADPDGRLSRAAELRLWYEAVRLTGDACFGLHLAERLTVAGFGALGYAVRSSATVGEAYQRAARYLRTLADGPIIEIHTEGDAARIRHLPPREDPPPSTQAIEFLMAVLALMPRRSADPAFVPRAVRLRHAAPARPDEHRRVFGSGVRFAQEHDELVMDRALFHSPQQHAEPALGEVLDRHLASLLAALPEERSFLDRVRAALLAEIGQGEPALPSIAARLHTSPRSLQRRLQQEGTSLSALLDRLRADLAVRYLSDSGDSIAEVAFVLGFSEVSTFYRAFKRWTGLTPASYRRSRRTADHSSKRAS